MVPHERNSALKTFAPTLSFSQQTQRAKSKCPLDLKSSSWPLWPWLLSAESPTALRRRTRGGSSAPPPSATSPTRTTASSITSATVPTPGGSPVKSVSYPGRNCTAVAFVTDRFQYVVPSPTEPTNRLIGDFSLQIAVVISAS